MDKKALLRDLGRSASNAFIYGIVIIAMLVVYSKLSGDVQSQTFHVQRAIACELGVPAEDGVRDPKLLRKCWEDEGLEAPAYFLESVK